MRPREGWLLERLGSCSGPPKFTGGIRSSGEWVESSVGSCGKIMTDSSVSLSLETTSIIELLLSSSLELLEA